MKLFTFIFWLLASSLYMFVHFYGTEATPVWDRGVISYALVALISAGFLGFVNASMFSLAQHFKKLSFMTLIFMKALSVTFAFIILLFVLKMSSPVEGALSTSFLSDLLMPQKISALLFLFVSVDRTN